MANQTSDRDSATIPSSTRAWSPWLAAGLVIFVFSAHLTIARSFPLDGYFVKYNLAAKLFLKGELSPTRLMDFSPLYFELALFLERLFAGTQRVFTALDWGQIAAVAAAAGLLYISLARRFATGFAVLGALAFAFDPHVLVYERIFEPEVFLVLCLLGCVVFVENRSQRSCLIAGVFAAAAITLRPTFMPLFAGAAPVYFLLAGLRGRLLVDRSFAFVFPVMLAAAFLGVRTDRITGDWSTPVMNPGTVFFEGNQALSQGTSAMYPPLVATMFTGDASEPDAGHGYYRRLAKEERRRVLSIAEINAFWIGKTTSYIFAEPGRYLRLLATKSVRIFHDYRWHDVPLAQNYDASLPARKGYCALIAALALVGAVMRSPHARVDFFFYIFALAQIGVMLIFYVSARQQMVMVPVLAFFATGMLEATWRLRWRSVALILPVAALVAIFLSPDDAIRDDIHREQGLAQSNRTFERAGAVIGSGRLAWHPEIPAKVLALAPWRTAWARPGYVDQEERTITEAAIEILRNDPKQSFLDEFDLATLELEAGDLDAAQARFESLAETGHLAYRTYYQASDPRFYLGRIAALRGEHDQAIEHLEAALVTSPGDPFVLAELIAMDDDPELRSQLAAYYSRLDGNLILGETFLYHGQGAKAVAELQALHKSLPGFRRGAINLAVAYGRDGQVDKGARLYVESLRLDPMPLLQSNGVGALFRSWAALHPMDLGVQLQTARVLYLHGRFREALAILRQLPADSSQVATEIKAIETDLGGPRVR